MDYAITLSGQGYTLATSDDAQMSAISACRIKYNEALPQTIKDGDADVPNPALCATDAAYLEYVFGHWAAVSPGSIDWKASSGWLTLDQATVTGIASAVAAYVQAAFSKEKLISDDIDAYNWS